MTNGLEDTLFIKYKNDTTELTDLLQAHKKDSLIELSENYAVPAKKSWNKHTIATHLSEKVLEQAETIYHPVLKDILMRLPDLETNLYRVKSLDEIQGFNPLIQKGFFFVSKEKESILLIIPEEILFSVKDRLNTESPLQTDKFSSEEKQKSEWFKTWNDKLTAIYGHAPLKHLEASWNRYARRKVTMDEIREILNQE
ncbi:hypothetical protein [Alkalibacterium kapii]|uniref:Uncharacterized protein n=1 Tax=Alkalibacterium kapii TaxID=426704 RepID=A0A511AVL6_9LACT|nr:hypothetical protein [Alkalibacterium kapii]GEK92196.1 hypothetical protein AKA01nite_18180 [Alkalibacterium kapii]